MDAIGLSVECEGVVLDPAYERKSMAALTEVVRDGVIPNDSRVPYARSAGQPVIIAPSLSSAQPHQQRLSHAYQHIGPFPPRHPHQSA